MTSYVDPAKQGIAITPSDSADFSFGFTRGIYVGGAGNISVEMANGTVMFYTVNAGSVLPLRVKRVNATGTTASNLVGLY
jgi:hypothetical protein